jgi:hypothetical protein
MKTLKEQISVLKKCADMSGTKVDFKYFDKDKTDYSIAFWRAKAYVSFESFEKYIVPIMKGRQITATSSKLRDTMCIDIYSIDSDEHDIWESLKEENDQ